jgi:hypothetical protein
MKTVGIRAKNRFPLFPLEITVRNKVPSENTLVGTSFLTIISWGT